MIIKSHTREKAIGEWRLFCCAIMFFTRIPVSLGGQFDESEQAHAARYLPLVGWLVGIVAILIYIVFSHIVDHQVAIVFAMLSTVLMTGAFHEDGLADTFDGLVGGWTPEQRLKIMKDSAIGSYGAIALVFVFLLKFALLSAMDATVLIYLLLCGPVVSRLAANFVMYFLEYVRLDGSSKVISVVKTYDQRDMLIAALCSAPLLVVLPSSIALSLMTILGAFLLGLWMRNRIGGYTGDTLGATQQISEISLYFAALAII